MIVTTSGRPNAQLIQTAQDIALELKGTFLLRNKQTVENFKKKYQQNILVVGKNRLELHFFNQVNPLFFHPNSAMFRIKRLLNGENDPFCDACNLQPGHALLDCTLGLASDSIVASYVVGEKGNVMGIEKSSSLAYIVKMGLKQWKTGLTALDDAMNRINVIENDHLSFLRNCPDNSFDVVYFDPMFEETIEESIGILPLKRIANFTPMQKDAIDEAKRVAKRRIVLKDYWKSSRFEEYGFNVHIRKSAKFHYGVIEILE